VRNAKYNNQCSVERIGSLVRPYIRGVIIRVILDEDGIDWLDEYEVDFGKNVIATFYEGQLRLVKKAPYSN
jgi:hypothetical protein